MPKPMIQAVFGVTDEEENASINELLCSVRRYLGMEVAFLAKFTTRERVIEIVNVEPKSDVTAPSGGHSDRKEQTYCQRILEGSLPELIPDTQANDITSELEVTRELDIGSYIGVPIRLPDGEVYGTLCCYESAVNYSLTPRDVSLLKVVADFIGRILNKRVSLMRHQSACRDQLGKMIANDQLDVVFQPVFKRDGKQIECLEALARFNSEPYRPPNEWIHEAECSEFGIQVETAIIRRALRYMEEVAVTGFKPCIALNISVNMLENGNLPALLEHVSPAQVKLEITEHVEIADYALISALLSPLTERGFKVMVDDVGAGFASMRHILELRPSGIKLDISLVSNISNDPNRQAMAAALIAYAKTSGLSTVAEGIESEADFEKLKELGIEYFQGYFFQRPIPMESILENTTLS